MPAGIEWSHTGVRVRRLLANRWRRLGCLSIGLAAVQEEGRNERQQRHGSLIGSEITPGVVCWLGSFSFPLRPHGPGAAASCRSAGRWGDLECTQSMSTAVVVRAGGLWLQAAGWSTTTTPAQQSALMGVTRPDQTRPHIRTGAAAGERGVMAPCTPSSSVY